MELKIVKFFNSLNLGLINKFADIVSRLRFLFIFWVVVALSSLLFDRVNGKNIAVGMLIVSGLHFLITEGLIKHLLTKIFWKRWRPYLKYPEIKPIGRKFSDSSFPSSHMATTVAMLFFIISIYPALWPLAGFLILLMAYARLYQGMHYPSDILAGIILGVIYGWVGILIVSKII